MKTKYLAFGSMKGGVGKTTLNSIIANYIHNSTDKTVVVLDSDDSQQSLSKLRSMDILDNEDVNESSYPLISVSSKQVSTFCIENLDGEVDYVIIDLPGNINQDGVLEVYSILDYLFIPTRLDVLDVSATIDFINNSVVKINQLRESENFKPLVVTGCINNIDKRSVEYREYKEQGSSYITELIPFIGTVLPHSNVFSREVNTFKEFKHKIKSDLIKHFCQDVFQIIK